MALCDLHSAHMALSAHLALCEEENGILRTIGIVCIRGGSPTSKLKLHDYDVRFHGAAQRRLGHLELPQGPLVRQFRNFGGLGRWSTCGGAVGRPLSSSAQASPRLCGVSGCSNEQSLGVGGWTSPENIV